MKRSKFIQGLTLLSFIFLLTAFVLYRMGKFDGYFSNSNSQYQTSPNGGSIGQQPTDTVPKRAQDSSARLMLSSSKSMVLIDQKLSPRDSIKLTKKLDSLRQHDKAMMSSSKSSVIFTPPKFKISDTFRYIIPDSIKNKKLYKPDNTKKH